MKKSHTTPFIPRSIITAESEANTHKVTKPAPGIIKRLSTPNGTATKLASQSIQELSKVDETCTRYHQKSLNPYDSPFQLDGGTDAGILKLSLILL